ncbi:MAG: tannase/feruloyl esterase family alpha/beta hydrolase [Gammaproteobacteria bacterium]|jgi:hypothetical protein|nr:tannase/feruloyl esterase family alpha/beta hydrolase [Gammaproteobacteria bacterium]
MTEKQVVTLQLIKRLMLITFSFCSFAAVAETNSWSFTDVAQSHVNYGQSDISPVINCRDLTAISNFEHSVISATLIPEENGIPESCQVIGVIPSEIQYRINLPIRWNRRLYVHGNGAYGGHSVNGSYGLVDRQHALKQGFVTAFSNLGHDKNAQPGGSWAFNAIDKEIDYSYRALHLTTRIAKQLTKKYYRLPTSYSYYDGCSTAGGQGIKAALRYPADFDGILVGSPVFNFVSTVLYAWNNQMAQLDGQFNEQRVELLANIIMSKYDNVDNVVDGIIENPLGIDFNPAKDLPRDASAKTGFTDREIEALIKIYGGLVIDGKQIVAGIPVGAEPKGHRYKFATFEPVEDRSAWWRRVFPNEKGFSEQIAIIDSWFRYLAFEKDDANVDWKKLDIKQTLPRLQTMSKIMDANSTDFTQFRDRGGKLLAYHGWADVGVNPHVTVDYYKQVVDDMGKDTDAFFRLFLVPGGFHCWGGLGADRFDGMSALIDWVEAGVTPESIKAIEMEKTTIVREHPLCPYPKIAHYNGRGNSDKANSYSCDLP